MPAATTKRATKKAKICDAKRLESYSVEELDAKVTRARARTLLKELMQRRNYETPRKVDYCYVLRKRREQVAAAGKVVATVAVGGVAIGSGVALAKRIAAIEHAYVTEKTSAEERAWRVAQRKARENPGNKGAAADVEKAESALHAATSAARREARANMTRLLLSYRLA